MTVSLSEINYKINCSRLCYDYKWIPLITIERKKKVKKNSFFFVTTMEFIHKHI